MRRSNTMNLFSHDHITDLKQKIAYHEAGHAAGIHFSSIQKNLPAVFYEIVFKCAEEGMADTQPDNVINSQTYMAWINGGRLIDSLLLLTPQASECRVSVCSANELLNSDEDYRLALETDITNLLIGSLAEAKYTALIDDEPFHHQLLTMQSLKNYGGEADLEVIYEYLQSYTTDEHQQCRMLDEIFIKAFRFVNDYATWKAVSRLAKHILNSHKNIIGSEEVAAVLNGQKLV